MSTSGKSLNAAAIEQLITQHVTEAMAAYEENQNNRNGDGNPHVKAGGVVPVARKCTYQYFVKCQPLNFKGTEGVVGLTRWFEKMETVFYISNCPKEVSSERTIGTDDAHAMTWKALIKLMTEMVPKEEDRVEKFIGGLPDNIQGNKVARVYTVRNKKNKGYAGILPLRDKCKLHQHGPCHVRCGNCKKVSHQTRDRWASTMMTCYGCGGKGHTKRYCPELGNQNRDEEARQNLDIVTGLGCEALVKRDTLDKLQERSVKCIFIGFPKETMGYYFYFPPENKIVVARYAEFLEKNLLSQEVSGRAEELEEIQDKDCYPKYYPLYNNKH
ncbi:putative reverse transcriptase domain-containing protein [Tanacetum coccineum]